MILLHVSALEHKINLLLIVAYEHSFLCAYRAEDLTEKFHAHFWDYSVSFISNPVDVDTPSDAATPIGVKWFGAQAQGISTVGIQAADPNRPSEAVLLCAVCNNITSPCQFDGICIAGTCECRTGSSGPLCQVTPDGNGLCDLFFNTPEFDYDGGDCCEATCVSTEYFSCGNGIIEQSVGAFGYVGFTDCEDPSVSSQISGSQTLFDIVQRGNVRCSSSLEVPEFVQIKDGIPSGFEVDIVSGVAACNILKVKNVSNDSTYGSDIKCLLVMYIFTIVQSNCWSSFR